jgi:hypothetical protein
VAASEQLVMLQRQRHTQRPLGHQPLGCHSDGVVSTNCHDVLNSCLWLQEPKRDSMAAGRRDTAQAADEAEQQPKPRKGEEQVEAAITYLAEEQRAGGSAGSAQPGPADKAKPSQRRKLFESIARQVWGRRKGAEEATGLYEQLLLMLWAQQVVRHWEPCWDLGKLFVACIRNQLLGCAWPNQTVDQFCWKVGQAYLDVVLHMHQGFVFCH